MKTRIFQLKASHILLLRAGNIQFSNSCEWGYIGLDCKRPFGNGDLVGDMARIVGIVPIETDDGDAWPKGTREAMLKIFRQELPIAMSIVLSGCYEPGSYVADEYQDNWRLV